jgi:uncharacterized membrane protein
VTDGRHGTEVRAVDRLTFFSDAVAAIAITLLAIDLPVPIGGTVDQFWSSIRRNDGHYAAFAISFLAIATAWAHHHDVFRYVMDMDSRLRTLNIAWLLTIILNPFATRLLTSRGHETVAVHALRFGFYSLVQALSAASLMAVLHHALSHGQARGMPPRVASATNWGSLSLMVGFGLSIPVFFVTTYAWALWFIGPPLVGQVHLFWRRDRRAPQE